MKFKFFLFLIFIGVSVHAQDLNYARTILDTLCSPNFHGRGYVNNGHAIAAKFIAGEFEKTGLKPLAEDFFQPFNISVNTFPRKLFLSVDNNALVAGKDYLCLPFSGSGSGKFGLVKLDAQVIKNQKLLEKRRKQLKGNFLLIDLKGADEEEKKLLKSLQYDPIGAEGVLLLQDEKLTHGFFQDQASFPAVEVLRSAMPEEPSSVEFTIENTLLENYRTQNVIGFVPGTEQPESFIVFSAHYDHLGRMGSDTWFPGANDNASGTAMLLDLARHYVKNPHKYSVAFMAFSAEEVGLLGSKHYVENPLFPLKNIRFLVNMDIMGTGDEGIMVVNGAVHEQEFNLISRINEEQKLLAQVKKRGKAANSDHYWFSENGVPAIFVYTMGGIKAYHDIYDRPETLPLTEYEDVFRLLTGFMERF